MKMSARAVHSPLHLDFDVTFCPAAAGQNFVRLDKSQRFGQPVNLAGDQPGAAGAAVAFATLVFYLNVMRFQRRQQGWMFILALQASARDAQYHAAH